MCVFNCPCPHNRWGQSISKSDCWACNEPLNPDGVYTVSEINTMFPKHCHPECLAEEKRNAGSIRWHITKFIERTQYAIATKSRSKDIHWRFDNFDHAFDYLLGLWEEQKGGCQVSGLKYDLTGEDYYRKVSIDRINSDGHYEPGNLRFVIWGLNSVRSDLNDRQLLEVAQGVVRKLGPQFEAEKKAAPRKRAKK